MSRKQLFLVLGTILLLALATVTIAQEEVRVITNVNLNLRAQPNGQSSVLSTVPYNTELTASAISPDRYYVAVQYNGQGGWLALAYTGVLSGSLGNLPVSQQQFTALGSATMQSDVMVVPSINLRYRLAPTLDERPTGAIPHGTQLPAIALSEDGQFVLVSYEGQRVWVYREYLIVIRGNIEALAGQLTSVTASEQLLQAEAWTVTYPGPVHTECSDSIIYDTTEELLVIENTRYTSSFLDGHPVIIANWKLDLYEGPLTFVQHETGEYFTVDTSNYLQGDAGISMQGGEIRLFVQSPTYMDGEFIEYWSPTINVNCQSTSYFTVVGE